VLIDLWPISFDFDETLADLCGLISFGIALTGYFWEYINSYNKLSKH
jgi:hypothetical protein